MIFVFLWLASLGMTVSRSSHVAANVPVAFFLSLFFMTEQYSVSGHLGCLHVLAIEHGEASIFSN